jgi:uncharacterized membrane protein
MSKKLLMVVVLISLILTAFTYIKDVKAQSATSTPSNSTVDLACMQAAVEKRDNAVISAWDTLSASIKTALQTRRDALKAAWGISNSKERRKAIREAWANFAKSKKEASKIFNQARKEAWKQFRNDAKACRATATNEIEGNDIKF